MRSLSFLTFSLALTACAAPYRGVGPYRSADYVGGGESVGILPPPRATSGTPLEWPVSNVRINRGFRPPSDPRHVGVDLGGALGTPILAAHDGRVVYAGHDFHGYGNMVLLERDERWASLYAHMSRVRVAENAELRAGDVIGFMGRTGHATGVHLHFEVMREKKPIDPLPFLPVTTRGLASVRDSTPSHTR